MKTVTDHVLCRRFAEEIHMPFRNGFFAFPSSPPELNDTIQAAIASLQGNESAQIVGWPELPVFGASIPFEVKKGIIDAQVLICDITVPNLNVYYEIGYAVGLGKTIAPVVNGSFSGATNNIVMEGLFDVVGYKTYEGPDNLAAILKDLPESSLLDLYGRQLNSAQPLFLISAYRKTQFIASIANAVKASQTHFRTYDPVETPRYSLVTAIGDITSSAGIIIPFLESNIDDAARHNLRAALIAGLAHGLERVTLLLRHQTTSPVASPVDFRDDVVRIRDEKEIAEKVTAVASQTLVAAQTLPRVRKRHSRTALQSLTLGASAAENEFRVLDDYFVETSEYLRTARGEIQVLAGRKGSGKSAIFFMAREKFRRQRNSPIADLRPESHQLRLLKDELKDILSAGALDHTIAAFWYFLVLSEVLLAIRREIEFQCDRLRRSELSVDLNDLNEALQKLEIQTTGDFTSRINRLTSKIVQEISAIIKHGEKIAPDGLTNIVFRFGVGELRKLIKRFGPQFKHLIFLFDNIDKGWSSDGVDELDVRLVRLLLEALEKVRSDLDADRQDFIYTVFLRNDVYELMVSGTPDRGKTAALRIDWTDKIKLKQVIHMRLQASTSRTDVFNVLWSRFFVDRVQGKDSFDFFVEHCLMRPRFLIGIIEMAIANAIGRRHDRVDEEDCLDAAVQHANSILNDFAYEIRDVSHASENVLNALSGTTEYITKGEILDRFERANVVKAEDAERLFDYMLWYGVIGVVNGHNVVCFIYDYDYNFSRLNADILLQNDEPLYAFNPALHVALKSKKSN